ncbi:UNKNOWN [Stylonychia lemnae]|uniref:Uncharacterized protein n=1 Tax=Stylonychia lemnae TaxID=5949 RepID=A0A077ZYA1_STYLE|nr:UNKNOWN [Stylonychia lemnae]|eukprot:CDW73531.1 UNKNOWN [Stylonychia lemnae]
MSMVAKLKQATIEMGPQPIKYSKFSKIQANQLLKIIPDEMHEKFNIRSEAIDENKVVGASDEELSLNCLIVSTDITFEIWLLKPSSLLNSNVELDCIYRKKEEGIEQIDILHLNECQKHNQNKNNQFPQFQQWNIDEPRKSFDSKEDNINQRNYDVRNKNLDADYREDMFKVEEEGVYDNMTPLVAYTTIQNQSMLKIYSLKCDRSLHVLRFNSPITKFQSSQNSQTNQLIVLLQEGLLKIFNLKTLEQEISLKTFNLNPQSNLNSQALYESQLLTASLSQDFEVSHNLFAYIYNEINETDFVQEINKNVDQSLLGNYFLTKEATKQLIQLGQASINKVVNLMNVQKAMTIDNNKLQQLAQNQGIKQNFCNCKGSVSKALPPIGQNNNVSYRSQNSNHNKTQGLEVLSGNNQPLLEVNYPVRRSRVNSDQIQEDPSLKPLQHKSVINKENIFSVRVRDLQDSTLFFEIQPPFFKNISLVRFSPSGRYLLVGNENSQYFYIYEILPQQNQRFMKCDNLCHYERVRLVYSLFRGYTSAMVTDVQFVNLSLNFSDLEQILIINSSNGTSHIYHLNNPSQVNETPIQKKIQDDKNHNNIIQLIPVSRFKYKSLIKQGEIRIVSLISQRQNQESNNHKSSESKDLNFRILTFTSKNEFYVINAKTNRVQQEQRTAELNDSGIQINDQLSDDEIVLNPSQKNFQSSIDLKTLETFQLNINSQSFNKVNKAFITPIIVKYIQEQRSITKNSNPLIKNNSNTKNPYLEQVENNTFYQQMQIMMSLNPNINFCEPSKEFIQLNKSNKVLFDYDLQKHESMIKKEEKPNNIHNLIDFNYSYQSQFTQQSTLNQISKIDTQVKANQEHQNEVKIRKDEQFLNDYIIDDDNYFGKQSIIRKQSEDEVNDHSQSINLSEYLEKAYDRFAPDYQIRNSSSDSQELEFSGLK